MAISQETAEDAGIVFVNLFMLGIAATLDITGTVILKQR